jgi:DTW domain-containing protein YfiP
MRRDLGRLEPEWRWESGRGRAHDAGFARGEFTGHAGPAGDCWGMGRSLVTNDADRCERCRCAPRWCICAGHEEVACPVAVDVLIHQSEFWRPTSTGRLLQRVVAGARTHVYQRHVPPARAAIALPGRELWILHPRGEPVPELPADARARSSWPVQVLLLDGNWREAAAMARSVAGWGRLVRLPEGGPSRYELRSTPHAGTYATAEALVVLLETIGATGPAARLRRQFELHVYAGLRTRGAKTRAEEFLARSKLPAEMPELIAELNRRRRNSSV